MSYQVKVIRRIFNINLIPDDNIYHEIDIFRLQVDDWFIEKFQFNNENVYQAMTESMIWINQYKAYDRLDHYFPSEFFEIGDPDIFGRDKSGRIIMWQNFRIK